MTRIISRLPFLVFLPALLDIGGSKPALGSPGEPAHVMAEPARLSARAEPRVHSWDRARAQASLDGQWRAVLDLAGGPLRFRIEIAGDAGSLCNAEACDAFSGVFRSGDSVILELADYAAAIRTRV